MSNVETLHDILRRSLKAGASDVHFHVGSPVAVRVAGKLMRKSQNELTAESTRTMLLPTLSEEESAELKRNYKVEVMVDVPRGGGRFRGSYYKQQYGIDAVFRVIPPAVPSLTDLNLPYRLGALTTFRYGMMFVTGPAGCGKTSTLSGLVNHMNNNRDSHILMLESPVEYRHRSKRCIINQREIGRNTESLSRALRAGLREAPDVIVVGDIYDKETMGWALTAAETGHFVVVTLYTANATQTIDHVLSIFPPLERPRVISIMAESLRSIVSQRLVTTPDGKRRIPCLEVLLNTGAISNLIRQQETVNIRSIMEMAENQGMTTLEQSLSSMVITGSITRDEAFRHCVHKEAMTV